jgi:hypothetical protein
VRSLSINTPYTCSMPSSSIVHYSARQHATVFCTSHHQPAMRTLKAQHQYNRDEAAHSCEYSLLKEIALAPSTGLAAFSTISSVPFFWRCCQSSPKSMPRRSSSELVVACSAAKAGEESLTIRGLRGPRMVTNSRSCFRSSVSQKSHSQHSLQDDAFHRTLKQPGGRELIQRQRNGPITATLDGRVAREQRNANKTLSAMQLQLLFKTSSFNGAGFPPPPLKPPGFAEIPSVCTCA